MGYQISRNSLGLASAESLSATFGDLTKVSSAGYSRALGSILKRSQGHFHIFAGSGEVKAVRGHLHSEGVLGQVRFLGQIGDLSPLFETIDFFLAPFPDHDADVIQQALDFQKPVVAIRNSGSDLVGVPELSARTEAEYVELADRLIRNPGFRAKCPDRVP